ncbi:hypothetical protein P8Q88_03675 [Qipengyuania sp. XHP0207]|uniref:hypothetical protein n=1 Tax=Qipengyuania sp. XHP0207 TaxID=3038078 RepID=UPI00241C3953|nr:hypothetical protein [Qipengyuania sp. XHP0207]MDG5747272.1 hypothetical protein [Qipengyuania sp. XHP0207]
MSSSERTGFMKFAKLAVLAGIAVPVAAASAYHAASEVRVDVPQAPVLVSSGLGSTVAAASVERDFRQALAEAAADGGLAGNIITDGLYSRAEQAFLADPLDMAMIRIMTIGRIASEVPGRAIALLEAATLISKRDPLTNLWLAQNFAQAGDVDRMLASLDLAMRASPRAREAAIPILVNTLNDSRSFAPLGELLEREPEWEEEFWTNFVNNPVGLENSSEFFAATSMTTARFDQTLRSQLYANLRERNLFRDLAFFADANTGDDDKEGAFPAVQDGAPFGWMVYSDGSFSTRIRPDTGELEIDAEAGAAGLIAERIIALDGITEFSVRMAQKIPETATLEVSAICADEEESPIATARLDPNADAAAASFPRQNCDFANVRLTMSVVPGRQNALLRISKVNFY